MSSELRMLTGEMRTKDQRKASGMRANSQREASLMRADDQLTASELPARVEQKCQGEAGDSLLAGGKLAFLLALCSSFARTVILVTERYAVGRVASLESWLNAGGWIDDGQR